MSSARGLFFAVLALAGCARGTSIDAGAPRETEITVCGTVRDADGGAIADALVQFDHPGNANADRPFIRTDFDGGFCQRLSDEKWNVTVSGLERSPFDSPAWEERRELTGQTQLDVSVRPRRAITFHIVDQHGAPRIGALSISEHAVLFRGNTDADGMVQTSPLPDAPLTVHFVSGTQTIDVPLRLEPGDVLRIPLP